MKKKPKRLFQTVYRSGSSLVVTIPNSFVKKHNIEKGDPIKLWLNDKIVIKPIKGTAGGIKDE